MNDIVEMQQGKPHALVAATPATPADMVIYAMQNGGTIEQVREMMQLQREWEADQARKAYVSDMAEFKKNPPEVVKDKLVAFSGTSYMHATLGNVTQAIVAGLAQHGFSHRWDVEQGTGGIIVVTCILTHKLGHSEKTRMESKGDDSGKKNDIQKMASAVTYLQRYTLLAATGIATKDQGDDDGSSAAPQPAPEKHKIEGPTFDNMIKAVKAGKYSATDARDYYDLTADQETVLADAVKGIA